MSVSEPPGHSLSLEQRRQVEALAQSLTPMQAVWLGGYFTGLDVGLRQPLTQPASTKTADLRSLTIIYGTETGNAAELARTLKAAVNARSMDCIAVDMADYKTRQLAQEQDLLIIVSTYGEGDPPQPATGFFEFLEGRKAPRLEGIRFAVLALGDPTYEYFCQAGKRLDRRLEELGAARLAPRVECDVDYEERAEQWIASASPARQQAEPARGQASPAPILHSPGDAIIIRMSGYPNGCSRPYLAEIGLTGRAPGKYNLYLGGGFHGERLNRMVRENVGEPIILQVLRDAIGRFAREREAGEHFGDFAVRAGIVRAVSEGRMFNE